MAMLVPPARAEKRIWDREERKYVSLSVQRKRRTPEREHKPRAARHPW